eukprot:TRINITY_DN3591_c0_g1_i1.p1 TRINITY_DN3591_c0_g1~~TRINITY_DN3591_c0_g1_i1.p1  ORF type:complete len:109 (+),score=17.44 TRINITY_DN3591_c0_g1_i1:334-660(+)
MASPRYTAFSLPTTSLGDSENSFDPLASPKVPLTPTSSSISSTTTLVHQPRQQPPIVSPLPHRQLQPSHQQKGEVYVDTRLSQNLVGLMKYYQMLVTIFLRTRVTFCR